MFCCERKMPYAATSCYARLQLGAVRSLRNMCPRHWRSQNENTPPIASRAKSFVNEMAGVSLIVRGT